VSPGGGFAIALVRAPVDTLRYAPQGTYFMLRRYFGRSILLGLEALVAADLIRTVAVEPTVQNALVLGLIVLIRTFLSFSLEIEIDGRLPWRRGRLDAARAVEEPRQSRPRVGRVSLKAARPTGRACRNGAAAALRYAAHPAGGRGGACRRRRPATAAGRRGR